MNQSLDLPLHIKNGSNWRVLSNAPALRNGTIHVWRCYIKEAEKFLTTFADVLSDDERARANRFRFPKDSRRFVAVRGVLRFLMSRYSALPPRAISFLYGRYGKPLLADNRQSIKFNISHSGDLALFAVARNRPVGIDVEQARCEIITDNLAEQFLAPDELKRFVKLTGKRKESAFFKYWTQKESFIKAVGMGLSLPLQKITVPIKTTCGQIFTDIPDLSDSDWSVCSLKVDKSGKYAAAVTAAGNDWTLNP